MMQTRTNKYLKKKNAWADKFSHSFYRTRPLAFLAICKFFTRPKLALKQATIDDLKTIINIVLQRRSRLYVYTLYNVTALATMKMSKNNQLVANWELYTTWEIIITKFNKQMPQL